MGRSPCCDKVGLKKGPWTPEEDQKLLAFIEEHGHGCWRSLPSKAGLQRCGKSCRLRWTNYLRPDIKRGRFTPQEEQTIIQLHALLGNRWSAIASHLPKRTDNEIKNLWNTHLKKRLSKMGIDPATHKPSCDALSSRAAKASASLSHMAQWESARLEAEARLVREAKLLAAASPFHHLAASNPSTSSSSSPPYLDALTWQGVCKRKIDVEEPTSSLTFSDAAMGITSQHHHRDDRCHGGGEVAEEEGDMEVGEEVNWKCFPRPMQLFCGGPTAADDFPAANFPPFGTDSVAAWPGSTAMAQFGDSFTEMLLENPDDSGGKTSHENEDESRSYWSSIFGLVTSSSTASNSPT